MGILHDRLLNEREKKWHRDDIGMRLANEILLTSCLSATRHEWLNLFSSRHECFTSDFGLTRTRLVSYVLLTSLILVANESSGTTRPNGGMGHIHLRAKSHYVKFGLTRLRFSKFPWQRKKNGENAASNALSSTRRRGLRRRRCVCIFCVSCRLMTSTTVRWLIFRGKRSMSNHSHRRKISVEDKVLSLSTEIVHLASRVSLLTLGIHFLPSSRQPSR